LITTIGRNINFFHKAELKDYQIKEVDKMLTCGDSKNGFIIEGFDYPLVFNY